jgi:aldehyde:ferredoxin oxidoreductase
MSAEYYGYRKKILRVNLTEGTCSAEHPEDSIYRQFIGGQALALYYLLKELPEKTDALSPENKIIFSVSPMCGVRFSGQARHTVASVSPLTGGLADSQAGGWWGAELKFAGYDAVIVEGRSPVPVYLAVEDDDVRILPAEDLWGKTTGDVQDILKERHGTSARVLQIGPAGEQLVPYACITNELRHFNGRGGLGAVMGSKHLRAVVVKGSSRQVPVHDPEKIKEIADWFNTGIADHPALSLHRELGTPKGVVPLSVAGMLPTYNFQEGSFAGAQTISGEYMNETIGRGGHTCFACAVRCKRSIEGDDGTFRVTARYGGPEYETVGLFGSNLGVDNIIAVGACNELCNALGLDTISTAGTLAWAVECFQRGILTEEDTGGIELKWNDPAVYLTLIELTAKREGFGKILSLGSRRASEVVQKGSIAYAMQVKGQEFASHEPRGKWNVGLGYAVSPTGADHLQAAHDPWFTEPGEYSSDAGWVDLEDLSAVGLLDPVPAEDLSPAKVRLFLYLQQIWGFHDTLDLCIFTAVPEFRAMSLNMIVDLLNAVTGWRTSLFDLMKTAERGLTMARMFNLRQGLTAADDMLPQRMFEPLRGGTLKGHAIDRVQFERAVKLYYGMMGWSDEGVPSEAKLYELNLNFLV